MKRILLRLIAIIWIAVGCCIMAGPFIVLTILLGMDTTNIIMDKIFKLPLNWLTDSNFGDLLLKIHRNIKENGI